MYHKAVQLVFVRLIRTIVILEVSMEGIRVFILIVFAMSRSEASIPPKIAAVVVPESSVGSEAILICSLASGTRPVQFSWSKDGQEVPSKLMTNQPTSSTLLIPVVKSEDRGRYTCFVKSSFGEDSKSADLIVSGQLFFSSSISSLDFVVTQVFVSDRASFFRERTTRCEWSSRSRIQCRMQGCRISGTQNQMDEDRRLVFFNNTSRFIYSQLYLIAARSLVHHGEVLHIQSLNQETAGQYECEATNGIDPSIRKIISISFKGDFQRLS